MTRPETTSAEIEQKVEGLSPSTNGSVEHELRSDYFLIPEENFSNRVSFRFNNPDTKAYGFTKIIPPADEIVSGIPYSIRGYERNGKNITTKKITLTPDTRNFWGVEGMPQRLNAKRETLEVMDVDESPVSLERVHYKQIEKEESEKKDFNSQSSMWSEYTYFIVRVGGEVYRIWGDVGDDFDGNQKDISELSKEKRDEIAGLFLPIEALEEDPRDLE